VKTDILLLLDLIAAATLLMNGAPRLEGRQQHRPVARAEPG